MKDKKTIEKLEIDGKNITNAKEIANNFNIFFSRTGQRISDQITSSKNFRDYMENPLANSIYIAPTNEHAVEKIISSLKNNKSTGDDNITAQQLKIAKHRPMQGT